MKKIMDDGNMVIKTGYKLFEEDSSGRLFPLFIDKTNEVPYGEWCHAKYKPTKGFAKRGGWHIGDIPDAPWLKGHDGSKTGCYKSRFKNGKRVWCEVEYNATHDYNNEVSTLRKKCFENKIPDDGYYFFRVAGKGVWSITSDIKVLKKLDEEERRKILEDMGYDEEYEYLKYRKQMGMERGDIY